MGIIFKSRLSEMPKLPDFGFQLNLQAVGTNLAELPDIDFGLLCLPLFRLDRKSPLGLVLKRHVTLQNHLSFLTLKLFVDEATSGFVSYSDS
ncbi:hypothetical protein YC2023_005095 [Brassica napus]